MRDSPRVTHRPRADATPEGELHALATVYRFVLTVHQEKKGARPGALDDARKDYDDAHAANRILPDRM